MQNEKRLRIAPFALLAVLVLVTLLVVKRKHLTAEEAQEMAVWTVVTVENTAARDKRAAVALFALTALSTFLIWTAFRSNKAEKTMRPTSESSANDATASP